MAKKLPSHLHTIDNKKTGLHLHNLLKDRGLSVKDVQSYLGLSCPQGIYRWLDGRALPSIDNLRRTAVVRLLYSAKQKTTPAQYHLPEDHLRLCGGECASPRVLRAFPLR